MTIRQDAPLPTDPRLTDPDAARHVAELLDARRGAPPPLVAGIDQTRRQTRKFRSPDTDEVFTMDLRVPGRDGPRPARWYLPAWSPVDTSVLFLHGGGWALGDLEMNDAMVRELTRLSGCAVLSLDYRLAPEHPYPVALDDASAALRWLSDSEYHCGRSRLVLAGHSAGGNLAAVLARRSRDGDAPPVAAQVLLCPVLDSDLERDSYRRYGDGLLLTSAEMRWYWDMYHPGVAGREHPDLSPLRVSSPAGLAPATIVVAGADPLRDEAVMYGDLLDAAGVPTEVHVAEGVPHLFLTFPPMASRDHALMIAARGISGAR